MPPVTSEAQYRDLMSTFFFFVLICLAHSVVIQMSGIFFRTSDLGFRCLLPVRVAGKCASPGTENHDKDPYPCHRILLLFFSFSMYPHSISYQPTTKNRAPMHGRLSSDILGLPTPQKYTFTPACSEEQKHDMKAREETPPGISMRRSPGDNGYRSDDNDRKSIENSTAAGFRHAHHVQSGHPSKLPISRSVRIV